MWPWYGVSFTKAVCRDWGQNVLAAYKVSHLSLLLWPRKPLGLKGCSLVQACTQAPTHTHTHIHSHHTHWHNIGTQTPTQVISNRGLFQICKRLGLFIESSTVHVQRAEHSHWSNWGTHSTEIQSRGLRVKYKETNARWKQNERKWERLQVQCRRLSSVEMRNTSWRTAHTLTKSKRGTDRQRQTDRHRERILILIVARRKVRRLQFQGTTDQAAKKHGLQKYEKVQVLWLQIYYFLYPTHAYTWNNKADRKTPKHSKG